MPSLSDELLDDLVAYIRDALPDVIAIYLFGSTAGSTSTDESDVDVAVLLPFSEGNGTLAPMQRWTLQEDLAIHAGRDIDLVDLRQASTVMCAQIISSGTVVYCSDETERLKFEMVALSMYAHLNVERRHILRDIQERGSVYSPLNDPTSTSHAADD